MEHNRNNAVSKAALIADRPTMIEAYHQERARAAVQSVDASMDVRRRRALQNLCEGEYEVLDR
jgi:hypothetical protein